jgi:hypothetical protein
VVLARILALIVHEIVTEYRKLDAPETTESDAPRQELSSCTSADTERAAAWDHDKRPPPVAARGRPPFGFA